MFEQLDGSGLIIIRLKFINFQIWFGSENKFLHKNKSTAWLCEREGEISSGMIYVTLHLEKQIFGVELCTGQEGEKSYPRMSVELRRKRSAEPSTAARIHPAPPSTPDTVQALCKYWLTSFSWIPCEINTTAIPILQVSRRRHRDVKHLAHCYRAGKAELGVNSWQFDLRDFTICSLAIARETSENHGKTDMNKVIFF